MSYQKKGVICDSIKVRIKPAPPTWEVKSRPDQKASERPRGFNEVARRSWQNLVDKLAPESDLRKAVERLLQNKPK